MPKRSTEKVLFIHKIKTPLLSNSKRKFVEIINFYKSFSEHKIHLLKIQQLERFQDVNRDNITRFGKYGKCHWPDKKFHFHPYNGCFSDQQLLHHTQTILVFY